MQAYRLVGAAWRDEASIRSTGLADRAEEVSGVCVLVLGSRGTRAMTCPAAGDRVLLADARFAAKPDLYRLAAEALRNLRQAGGEIFFKGRDGVLIVGMMPRPGRGLSVAHHP